MGEDVKVLEILGIITEVDMAAFSDYSQANERWEEAEEFISKHGTIVTKQIVNNIRGDVAKTWLRLLTYM